MEKTTEEKARAKLLKLGEKESMEQGGSSATAVFCDAFFSCL